MEVGKVAENAIAAIENLVQHVPRKWSNVQSIYMKTNESVALPVFNALPDPEEEKAAREEDTTKKAEKLAARDKWRAEMEAERINTDAPPAKKKKAKK
jgi:ribosome biogenesis protein UTP30